METLASLVIIFFVTICVVGLVWVFGQILITGARGRMTPSERNESRQAMIDAGKNMDDETLGNWDRHLITLDQPQPREWRE